MNEVIAASSLTAHELPEQTGGNDQLHKLSAFFLNVEKALAGGPDSGPCEIRARAQLYTLFEGDPLGDLFVWSASGLKVLIEREKQTEQYRGGVPTDLAGGFTASDFDTEMDDEPADAHLCLMKARLQNVPGDIFRLFCDGYRTVKRNPSNHQSYLRMRDMLYPGLIRLGYFNWWQCRDKWAQSMVVEAKEKWDQSEIFRHSL